MMELESTLWLSESWKPSLVGSINLINPEIGVLIISPVLEAVMDSAHVLNKMECLLIINI